MELRDRTVLLTGAAGGLGSHIARALAGRGANLALAGLEAEREPLEELRDELTGAGVRAEALYADLTDREQLESLYGRAEQALAAPDVLVNNAGIGVTAAFHEFTRRELERIVAVNLTAPMLLTRHVVERMLERGHGHVVQIASVAGKVGTPYNEPYSATKAGLIALNQSLRAEYADAPVGFSAVCPGFVAGAGMSERAGGRLPFLARGAGPEAVGGAVVSAIERDRPEVITGARLLRVLLAGSALAPRLGERILRRVGTHEVFERMARARRRTA
jgi:short-subunit dehydrogenase